MNGTLSEFLDLLALRGHTWCFVDVPAQGGFRIARNDAVMFLAAVRGSIDVSGATGGPFVLLPGHVAMVLSGDALCIGSGADGELEFLAQDRNIDEPPSLSVGKAAPVATRLLCARLRVSWPNGLRRAVMPPVVSVGTERGNFAEFSSIRAETLQMSASGPGAAALLTRLAALMLTVSLRNHPQGQLLFLSSTWTDPVAHALHLIDSAPAEAWSVARLARQVGLSRSGFAARFSEQIGQTPMDVVSGRRMQLAADLLRGSELKLVDISLRVGYRSEAAFSRRFSRHFGQSPGEMRRRARREQISEREAVSVTTDGTESVLGAVR